MSNPTPFLNWEGWCMKKIYRQFCKIEEAITNLLLLMICLLVFVSAIARTIRHPLNWAVDISLLLFAWEVFLGGDVAIRNTELIGVDIFIKKFPASIQKGLRITFSFMILGFLSILVIYGIPLVLDSTKRLFQVLPLSYAWATLSVPVGAFFMIISVTIKLVRMIKEPAASLANKE